MVRLIGCAAAMALLVCPCASAQGTLERARLGTVYHPSPPSQPASSSAPSQSKPADSSGDGEWYHPGDADGFGALVVGAAIVAASPFWGPYLILEDNIFRPAYFPAHPYARPSIRYLESTEFQPQNGEDASLWDPTRLKPWSVRLSLENGNDFNGLNRVGGRLAIDTACRFGVQTAWNYFLENVGAGHSDESVLGDVNLTFRFAQADWVAMYGGLGGRLQSDRRGTRGGFNFLYGADVFPIDPVVISTSVDLGNLDSAFLVHARATVGWQIGRFELFAGYDFLRIGTVNLQGPLAGVRLWF